MILLTTLMIGGAWSYGWTADGERFSYAWEPNLPPSCVYLACGEEPATDVTIDTVAGKRKAMQRAYDAPEDKRKRSEPARTFKDMAAVVEESFTPASGTGCGTSLRKLTLKVQKNGATTSQVTVAFAPGVEAYFSPDGSRIAWMLDEPAGQVIVVPTQGPAMSIAASKDDTAGARKLARELEKKGFVTTRMTIAEKERAKTVVYTKPSAQKQAEQLAAMVGGTVEALNWETSAEIVLALAKGAAK